jgi:DNA-directed RNA polymerase omega subunit
MANRVPLNSLLRLLWKHPEHLKPTARPPGAGGKKHLMDKTSWNSFSNVTAGGQWPGIDSMYRLIVVAAQRNKQLTRGATPRLPADPRRQRNTTIALEEVKRGLVPFTITEAPTKSDNDASLLL